MSQDASLFRTGLLELQAGHPEVALPLFERAVAAAPAESRYHLAMAETLSALHRWSEAAAAYRRVLLLDPQSAGACFALGYALRSLSDPAGAIEAYEAALRLQPDFADACNNLGTCHQLRSEHALAESAFRRALALRSDVATYAVNLGLVLCQQRKYSEAAAVLRSTVERNPDSPEAAFNLGNALHGLGALREATEQYSAAVALRPNYPDALINLGNTHNRLGERTQAIAAYEAAIGAQPDSVPALNNLGGLLRTVGRIEEAESILRRGLKLDARHPALHDNLGSVLKDGGQVDAAIECFRMAVRLDPENAATHSNLAYAMSFQALDGLTILNACRLWGERHADPIQPRQDTRSTVETARREPDARLRVGYVSPDFRDHCQSLFTIPLLSHHDHAAFEIFCYSSVERPDDYTRLIAGYADVWRDVRQLDDEALCDVIRADRIDVLVDLTMHMADGRPRVFARKPAPTQIAWLAYPGTTGIAAMDFRLSDGRLDPPGFEDHYTERTVRLPNAFWCYDPLTNQPDVNDLPALSRGYVTFGCLNNPCKLTDHALRLWAPVMRTLPGSRLLLMAPPGRHRHHVLQRLETHGIASQRIDFVAYRPRAEYLSSYHDVDLGLDTFPYNGHTTSFDSFWMGVPVITRVGQTCVGRGGLSQLAQLDLVELAAESDEAFVATAVTLANDLPRLAALRALLRGKLRRSPLMDADRFARDIESAFGKCYSASRR